MELDRGEIGSERCKGKCVKTTSISSVKLCVEIPEWLLMEVLIRLPVKEVFRSKLVSKQWLSIISDPSFIRMYVSRASLSSQSQIWTFISHTTYVDGYKHPDYSEYELLEDIYSRDLISPSFLVLRCPFITDERVVGYTVGGVSNGLVLYVPCPGMNDCNIYKVCNPVTRQWISLRPYTFDFRYQGCCFVSHVENGVLSSYRVVRIDWPFRRTNNIVKFEVFISEINEWKGFDVCIDHLIGFTPRKPTILNGILHWMTPEHGIIAYDPYQKPGSVSFIALPSDIDPTSNDYPHLGLPSLCDAHQGCLRYFELSDSQKPPYGFSSLSVWILNDYSTGDWCLQHKVSSTDIIYDAMLSDEKSLLQPISFHPFDPDIVYLGYKDIIVSYNFKKRKLEAHVGPGRGTGPVCCEVPLWPLDFLFVIPPWPTSITPPLSFGVS